ncbi:hypothetical protein NFI96_004816 [Prochilodus magdalenae]|nr:hypothetical protein NFI96_004816 [Prochilodus magdalenae]
MSSGVITSLQGAGRTDHMTFRICGLRAEPITDQSHMLQLPHHGLALISPVCPNMQQHRNCHEREAVQKKTFTKWVNSHLGRVTCRIGDLYTDLRDGRMLIRLLEVLSGEQLPKPTKGRMRIHCLENVDKALQFLKEQKVHLENMGSHDIVDGNHRLTLGLIWTIILRFQRWNHTVMVVKDEEAELKVWLFTRRNSAAPLKLVERKQRSSHTDEQKGVPSWCS